RRQGTMKEAYVGPSIQAPSQDWFTKAELLRLLALDEAQLTEAISKLVAAGQVDRSAVVRKHVGVVRLVGGREVATVEDGYSRSLVSVLQTTFSSHPRGVAAHLT
ncbi:MAG TPA: hypothetical protein VNB06_17045, partial [Thermoanaerobaculia bacterium]|nr:hypothetical protein [Thermoanaerobaculia bacterium]